MAGIAHRAARSVRIWIFRWIQHILRAIGRAMALLVYKAFRTSRSFLRPLVQKTLSRFRFLKPYIGPLIPVILKIIQIAGYVIERLSAMLASDAKELAAEPRGLENLGNTCYFNSVMQPLCYTHSLKESLRESQTSGELTESLRNFYTDMLSGESGPFSPYAQHQIFGRESSRFDNKRQHDSHECLRHFLDNIRKEEKGLLEKASSGSSKNMLTVVDRVFGGHLMTVYVCMTCQGPYHVCEPCLDISLPICFERRKEGRKQGLNKTGKDVQMTEEDNGLEISEDETSEDSELEQTNEEDGDENNENTKKAGLKEEKDEEEEEEDVEEEEEEEEEEEKAEDKAEAKRREEEDQTEKKVTELEDEEVDSREGMEEEKERKQHREDESKEREARGKKKQGDKEQDEEYSSKEEGGEKADKHQNEAKLKEEQRMKEENTEEKEKDDSLKHRTINISEKIPDEEEKHVKEEKHEKEKLEDNEHIRYKEENKDRRCKKNRRKELGKPVAVKDQKSSTLVENDCEVQQQSVEFKLRPQQKLNLKSKTSTEPEVRASVISQERSDGRTLNASDDEEQSRENDPYKNTIRLLMKPLSTCSNPQLSSIDSNSKSVEDCLMHFTRREHIHKEYLCNPCRHLANGGEDVLLTSATKQTMIFNPPAILTLHLKRFELKPGGSVKRKDMITYGELLDIAPYCSSMCRRNDPPCQNIWYSLYAVVVHSGSLECGHYKSYVKVQRNEQLGTKRFLQMEYFNRDVTKEGLIEMAMEKQRKSPAASSTNEVWYCANDSSISESSLSEVLNQEAYLLFYERLN